MVGLQHEVTYANVERAIQVLKSSNAKKPILSVSTVTTGFNEREIRKWKRYWRRRGIKASASACENRGGNIPYSTKLFPYGLAPNLGCKRPSYEAVGAYNGDVLLCCVDWWRTLRLGNLRKQTLEEIWNCEKIREIHRAHAARDDDALPKICRDCKVSHLSSRQHLSLKGLRQRFIAFKYRSRARHLQKH
jgi:radical SAM protein with 4Fe4S-binding SPASM domain